MKFNLCLCYGNTWIYLRVLSIIVVGMSSKLDEKKTVCCIVNFLTLKNISQKLKL